MKKFFCRMFSPGLFAVPQSERLGFGGHFAVVG